MEEKVELKKTGQIELPTIDMTQYVGKDAKIESVDEYKGQHGYYVKVVTETIDTIEGREGDVELKASRIFGLQEDKDGNIGWGKDTKMGFFLDQMKVNHYNDLKGKVVKVQQKTNNDGRKFLTFD